MSVTINGETVYPQSLIEFINTPDGLRKAFAYLESQKVERTIIKGDKK